MILEISDSEWRMYRAGEADPAAEGTVEYDAEGANMLLNGENYGAVYSDGAGGLTDGEYALTYVGDMLPEG